VTNGDLGGVGDIDPLVVFRELAEVADEIGHGSSPRQVLSRALELAQRFTGAEAACFIALEPDAGRVVGMTESAAWLEGRRFPLAGSAMATLLDGSDRCRVFDQAETAPSIRLDLSAHGVARVALARIGRGPQVLGAIAVLFADPAIELTPLTRSVLEYIAAGIGALSWLRPDAVPDDVGVVNAVPDRRSNEARDLFLATTSHELRTPLTVVRGYAETLANRWDDIDEEARLTAVRAIRDRTRQLAVLVDRLLLADSSDSTEVAAERTAFDLGAALAAAVRAAPKPVNTKPPVLDLPEHLPWALGDRHSIGTVVTELLTNADKYSPVGGEVTISADANASSVFFRVADRGIGVDPAHLDAVFNRFWQADQGDQRQFGGVGLGLYIIRRLLDRQGGWVSLRPRPGGGTVVEVRLPRAAAPGAGSANHTP
jgi:signal transduction histidine kinase